MSDIGILIADDHELVRLGLIRILRESHPEWRIVGEAANGRTAVDLGLSTRPQIAILDLFMPDMNGLEVARRLMESVPGIRIVILTMYAAKPIVRQLRRAGVRAYLAKNEAPRTLVRIVERSLCEKPFYASACTAAQADQAAQEIPAQFLLTPRELDVLRLLARGKSNKELAAELDMGVRTAESHHANLLVKLRVDSLAELVRRAVRDGVV